MISNCYRLFAGSTMSANGIWAMIWKIITEQRISYAAPFKSSARMISTKTTDFPWSMTAYFSSSFIKFLAWGISETVTLYPSIRVPAVDSLAGLRSCSKLLNEIIIVSNYSQEM